MIQQNVKFKRNIIQKWQITENQKTPKKLI